MRLYKASNYNDMSRKAEAIYNSFFGPITPSVPASVLQLHNDITVIADEDALSLVLNVHDISQGGYIL